MEPKHHEIHNTVIQNHLTRMLLVPGSSAAGPLGSAPLAAAVVLADPALRVHREADVNATFELRVDAVEHVDAEEALLLGHHDSRLKRHQ